MTQMTPFASAELGSALAFAVGNLRELDPLTLNRAFFTPRLGRIAKTLFTPHTPTEPAWFFITDNVSAYLVLDGTQTWDQATGIVLGYIGGPLASVTQPVNQYFIDAATKVVNDVLAGGGFFPANVFVGGWSLGGAVGSVVPVVARGRVNSIAYVHVHTFGAPRIGGRNLGTQLESAATITRWMNNNDPVPLLPPRVLDFPAILPLFGVRGALRADNFVQSAGGVALDQNGNVSPAVEPPQAAANFTASLAQWWVDIDTHENPSHSIVEYTLRLVAAEGVQKKTGRLMVGKAEKPVRSGSQAITMEGRSLAAKIQALAHQQGAQGVVIPPDKLFKAVRLSGIWYVKHLDSLVVTVGSKRGARAMARAGNLWLRELQTKAVVSPTSVLEQLQKYFSFAVDPQAGFKPTMNFTAPT